MTNRPNPAYFIKLKVDRVHTELFTDIGRTISTDDFFKGMKDIELDIREIFEDRIAQWAQNQ